MSVEIYIKILSIKCFKPFQQVRVVLFLNVLFNPGNNCRDVLSGHARRLS